ncbi:MAG: hydrogenase/urease maturation nickel metallochaperone HypA [Candidatus Woesearchaeota archaeon]|nr:hydrogenase/urease maturation nickel metallochaperone HypA [Candidatus Woesearchaeota archaeon]
MHETIIANQLIEEAKKQGNVRKIVVEVGELADMPAEELGETLKAMVPWEVVIVKAKAKVTCPCGYEGDPKIISQEHDAVIYECPECTQVPDVAYGDEIILKEVVVQ